MNLRSLLSAIACALLLCFLVGCGSENKTEANQRYAEDVLSGMRFKKLSKELDLTVEQRSKVKALYDQETKEIRRIHDDPNLSVLEKADKITALHGETYGKIRPLLIPAQAEKLDEIQRKPEKRRRRN